MSVEINREIQWLIQCEDRWPQHSNQNYFDVPWTKTNESSQIHIYLRKQILFSIKSICKTNVFESNSKKQQILMSNSRSLFAQILRTNLKNFLLKISFEKQNIGNSNRFVYISQDVLSKWNTRIGKYYCRQINIQTKEYSQRTDWQRVSKEPVCQCICFSLSFQFVTKIACSP